MVRQGLSGRVAKRDMDWLNTLKQLDAQTWELPESYKPGMRVPGMVFADDALLSTIAEDQALEQVANVAFLPGIVGHSLAMPDIHWGYGFPIGGVAATDVAKGGVISPGGVGFDINCGVRLLRSDLSEAEVRPRLRLLMDTLFRRVPTGVGGGGRIKLSPHDLDEVLLRGANWAVDQGYGDPDDLEVTEENGCIASGNPGAVGERPRKRGAPQLGTVGSGNHFLEVQAVDQILDPDAALAMGIRYTGQVTVLIHCGSRGLGHQVCTDYLKVIEGASGDYGISLPDRQLASVPVDSPEGQDYLAAMGASANFAWANRQCLAHWTRLAFEEVFDRRWSDMGMWQIYDVSHNIAKIEEHIVQGEAATLCVHRKGATRAFPPGHPDTPERYRGIGQPVLVPGDMGRYSFLAVAGPRAMDRSFGSTCHGAGRVQSRSRARKLMKGRDTRQELEEQGIIAIGHNWASLAEEAPLAYKDVADVIRVADGAGLARPVARMRPLGVIKG
jgi:tRNA-splicing ligase RtcB